MDDSIRRLLGIRKEISWVTDLFWKFVSKLFTVQGIVIAFLVIILITSYFLHMHYEYKLHPETLEDISVDEVSPYFMSGFWLIGTLIAGYAEAPYSTVGRILDIVVILVGLATTATIISAVTSKVVSANMGNMFGMAKTTKKIDCIICGWNPISEAAYKELESGSEVVVIDKQTRPELESTEIHFIVGDPTNPNILKRANVLNAKSIVLAMEEDSEVLLAIHVIRDLNPWINIVAKINNHEHIKIAEVAGADQVVSPPSIGGRLLSLFAEEPSVVDWVIESTSGEKGIKLVEHDVHADSRFANKTIGHIRHEYKGLVKVIGLDTPEGFEKIPKDDQKVNIGDKLLMIVDTKKVAL